MVPVLLGFVALSMMNVAPQLAIAIFLWVARKSLVYAMGELPP